VGRIGSSEESLCDDEKKFKEESSEGTERAVGTKNGNEPKAINDRQANASACQEIRLGHRTRKND
jgi:hypothetical protein